MFAHALGCAVLAMLVGGPAVAEWNGYLFCHDRDVDAAAVLAATDQRSDHGPLDMEFPRRVMTVWFYKPVKVGDRVLIGQYIIEHDDARMALGRPCTHIYRRPETAIRGFSLPPPHAAASERADGRRAFARRSQRDGRAVGLSVRGRNGGTWRADHSVVESGAGAPVAQPVHVANGW
jgi:hypothetical protein